MTTPTFSVIIPAFNRAWCISRAIDSCLRQGDDISFEVVTVDDASTDETVAVVTAYTDSRVRLERLAQNRGVCAARNAGIRAARGEWLLMLDSDDELLPDAFVRIAQRVAEVPPAIQRLVFMYELDTGGVSPEPALRHESWDFAGYLRWLAATLSAGGSSDFFNVIRRSAALAVPYPESRALEASFHLDFAHRFQTVACPDIVAIVHSDAPDRSLQRVRAEPRTYATDAVVAFELLLSRHGKELSRVQPAAYAYFLWAAANANLLAGHRLRGALTALCSLRVNPLRAKVWVALFLGMVSPRLLSLARRKLA